MSNLILHKANDSIYKDPLTFIDTIDNSKHIVLCYENQQYGKKIQLRFIKNGLQKGENCIFITCDDDSELIESEMVNYGIDVEGFYKKGLLDVWKAPNIMDHSDEVIRDAEGIIDKVFYGLASPFRLVARMFDKIKTEEQIIANTVLERLFNSKFERFKGLLLCPYDLNNNPLESNRRWVESILENHHSVIFITDAVEEGIAFDTIQ